MTESVREAASEPTYCGCRGDKPSPEDVAQIEKFSAYLKGRSMGLIRDLTEREKAIAWVALMAMAADETPFDIGEGLTPADAGEVEAVARLLRDATGIL